MKDQADRLRELIASSTENGEKADLRASDIRWRDGMISVVPQSIPTGRVSYGPAGDTHDQEEAFVDAPLQFRTPINRAVRSLDLKPRSAEPYHRGASSPEPAMRLARAIAVCSGKGGVGKSNVAVNLAVAMSQLDQSVCLLDADLGMANADLLCSLTPRFTMDHVVAGKCSLRDVMMTAPGGFQLVPGASGVDRLAELDADRRELLLAELARIERDFDYLIVDIGAGVGSNAKAFAAAAKSVLVITTPEPTAVTDAYGMIKSLIRRVPGADIHVLVNMAASEDEAGDVFVRLNRVSQRFLDHPLKFAGCIPVDAAVPQAVRRRLPFTLLEPNSAASKCVHDVARRFAGIHAESEQKLTAEPARGFFAKLSTWLSKGRK